MKIEIAQHDRMTESGSSLLRLIQNQDIPVLDLLVREAFQNSLDAGDKDRSNMVRIDISCKSFKAPALNRHFDRITDGLNVRYPDNRRYNSIVIADRGTVGLTGPMSYDEVKGDDFGNLLKLVYEISKPQTQEGAGGAWGLGKTVYYRVGMGLVIYYSRIRKGIGKYESRLAACLVENEKSRNQLIPSSGGLKRGIAWWGEEKGVLKRNQTVPVTDEREIKKILDVFAIQPYGDKETGTTVIIPYIDETALLKETFDGNSEASGNRPPWTYSIEEYLNVAVQRWYAPRLNNPEYDGLSLTAWIGDKRIRPADMLPLFRIVRELYMYRKNRTFPADSYLEEKEADVRSEDIQVRGVLNTSIAGTVVYTKLKASQLDMLNPDNNPSPYIQIMNEEADMEQGNNAIVMFTRKPGMIVGYDYSGSWTSRMPKTPADEYIIGLFVANSSNTFKELKDNLYNKPLTVEEYIRQCEKADHAAWGDKSIDGINPKLIIRIQNGVNNKIAAAYKYTAPVITTKKNYGLGHALANLLLPNRGFGNASARPPKAGGKTGGGSGGSSGRRTSALVILQNLQYKDNLVGIPFQLEMRCGKVEVRSQVVTDFRKIGPENWENETGKKFPFTFAGIRFLEMKEIGAKGGWRKIEYGTDLIGDMNNEDMEVKGIRSGNREKAFGFSVRARENVALRGIMILANAEKSMSLGFETREVRE